MKELTSFSSATLTRSQIVHVHFPSAPGDVFFSSLAAIYEIFTPEEVGVDLHALYSMRLVADGFPFTSPTGVEIRKVTFYRKKQGASK